MIDISKLAELRRRAELLLEKSPKSNSSDSPVSQLVEELNLYQTELEIQNEDLIKTQIDLQSSHDKYADLYHLAPVAYFTLNSNGLIIDVNQAGLDLLGIKKRMLINRCFSRYILPESQMIFSQYRQAILNNNEVSPCELKMMHWSAPPFVVQLGAKAVRDDNSGVTNMLICITDITKRIQMENFMHLQQARIASIDRIRSMNEQVYSISGNQNHSLSVIDNYIYGCIRRLESDNFKKDELILSLKRTLQQTRVLADIITQMKNFASRILIRYELSSIQSIVNEALALIQYESGGFPVKVHFEVMDNIPPVKLDKLHVQHVILSLARNAIEAMRDAAVNDPKLFIEAGMTDSNAVKISFIDNGPGFDSKMAWKLFEPGFTTKPYAMGFGLSIGRTIVERHSGELLAQPNSSGGAHFQMLLPCIAVSS